jgi:predicted transcriptional regulator
MSQEGILKLLEKNKSKEFTADEIASALGIDIRNFRKNMLKILEDQAIKNKIRVRESITERGSGTKYFYSWTSPITATYSINSELKGLNDFSLHTPDKLLLLILNELRDIKKILGGGKNGTSS